MKLRLLFFLFLLCSKVTQSDPQVTYVGEGRYVCQGSVQECNQVQRRNDLLELKRLQKQWDQLERRETTEQLQKICELPNRKLGNQACFTLRR